jgi:hypothetical protein
VKAATVLTRGCFFGALHAILSLHYIKGGWLSMLIYDKFTNQVAGRGMEGLGFAVSIEEVKNFLKQTSK